MSKSTKQALTLGLLLAALGGVLWYQLRTPETAIAPAVASNPPVGVQNGAAAPGDVTDVELDLLSQDGERYTAPVRDPFRFRQAAPPPQPPRPPEPPQPTVTRPPPQPVQPQREPISQTVRVLGIASIGGTRVAILGDGTSNPPLPPAAAGDVVEVVTKDGRYLSFRLLRVNEDSVEMAYLDGGSPQRIPLPGQ